MTWLRGRGEGRAMHRACCPAPESGLLCLFTFSLPSSDSGARSRSLLLSGLLVWCGRRLAPGWCQ